jgi:hypothetical protein
LTPTITPTPVPATPTNTPIPPILIWPNPFNPAYAFDIVLYVSGLPPNSQVSFYTVAGQLVTPAIKCPNGGQVTWDGKNGNGKLVSAGIYFYVVQSGTKVLLTGKLIFLNN